jgi:hypothetical protein
MNDFELFMYEGPTKRCSRCHEDLPLEAFGVDRERKDGKNMYCKPCICIKARSRKRKKPKRKPMTLSRLSPRTAIITAVRNGFGDRRDIQQITGIDWEELCDLIAELSLDEGILKFNRVTRKFEAA